MGTHFSILAWIIPWTEEPGRVQSMGSQRIRHAWETNTFTSLSLMKMNIHIYEYDTFMIHIQRDLSWSIGSCNYGDWEVPWFALSKLHIKASWWHSLKVLTLESQMRRIPVAGLLSRSENQQCWAKKMEEHCPISCSHTERVNPPIFHIWFYLGPQETGWYPGKWERGIHVTPSTAPNANLIRNTHTLAQK